jgi:hypothetical protein
MGKFPWRYYSFTLKLQWRLCLTLCVFQSNNYYYIWIIIESRWWAQVSSPVGFSSKRARAHCHLQTESFIGKKDLVRGGGIFPLWLIHCPLLRVSKRTFQSWTDGKNRTSMPETVISLCFYFFFLGNPDRLIRSKKRWVESVKEKEGAGWSMLQTQF